MAKYLGVKVGTVVDVSISQGRLIAAPIGPRRARLEDLLQRIEKRTLHGEVRTGPGRRGRAPDLLPLPKAQWKTLRTTNVIERVNEEFRRRVKTQGALPTDDAAVTLLFSLVASGQIRLGKIDGYQKIAAVLSTQRSAA